MTLKFLQFYCIKNIFQIKKQQTIIIYNLLATIYLSKNKQIIQNNLVHQTQLNFNLSRVDKVIEEYNVKVEHGLAVENVTKMMDFTGFYLKYCRKLYIVNR